MNTQPYTILIVDDTPEDCVTYQRFLRQDQGWQYKFLLAENGARGIALCHEAQPSCVLLDYRLPDQSGLEVQTALADERGEVACPVVMLTGTDEVEIAVQAMKLGAQDFINKNHLTPLDLQRAVHNAVERVRLRQALQEQERRFGILAETIPQLVWTCTVDGLCDYLSSRWMEYSGTTLATNLGYGWLNVLHPDDVAHTQEVWSQSVTAATGYEVEFRLRRADGMYRWHLARAVPMTNAAGAVLRWVGSCTDIEERKQAEEVRVRLAAIVESSSDAIIAKDLSGVITNWNAGAQQLFGYTEAEALGQTIYMLIPPELHAEETSILSRMRAGERIEHYETVRVNQRGERLNVSLTLSPLRDASEKIIGISKIARDITERKRIEAEREQLLKREQHARTLAENANRLKDEFLATLSHELRTPLNHSYGWVKMLRGGKLAPSEEGRALEIIERNLQAQNRLIEDLLDVSRIITGRVRLEVQAVSLSEVLERAVEAVRPAAEAKNVQMEVHSDPPSSTITGDPDRLQQIVWNLVSNAIKFTPPDGHVQVILARSHEFISLIVSDTGEGVAPEFLPYIFDRFSQQDSALTRRHGGLGLGLAIVRYLVELHGGHVTASSPGTGQGATFTVTLPLRMADRAWQKEVLAAPAALTDSPTFYIPPANLLTDIKVLAVDDEPDALALLTALLTPTGAEVRTANGMLQALDVLQEWTPDVLVSDIGMPNGDGYELIRRVHANEQEQLTKLPAVALTAYASAEDRMRALVAGYQMHVAKPVEPEELITIIASLTGRLGLETSGN